MPTSGTDSSTQARRLMTPPRRPLGRVDGPAGGLADPAARPVCLLQAGDRNSLYLTLTAGDIGAAARALASCWRSLGVRRNDRVLIFDYGTSPLTLFASWSYVPYLRSGAADLLGAVPVCNDGLPEFAPRALHLVRFVRPRVAFVDAGAMPALVRAALDEGFAISDSIESVVVSSDEEMPEAEQVAAWSLALGVPVRWLMRAEAALFFAAQCERGAFHVDRRFYRVEVVPEGGEPASRGEGLLCVTNSFLQGSRAPRYLTDIPVRMGGRCPCGAAGRAVWGAG